MSKGYYAKWRIGDDLAAEITIKLFIGKQNGPGGLSTMSGRIFPTKDAWKTFLTHNRPIVTIVDEYGTEHDIDEFIKTMIDREGSEVNASECQIQWLRDHGHRISDQPQDRSVQWGKDGHLKGHWLEGEQLFYVGEFH